MNCAFSFLQRTTALTYSVANVVKRLFIVVLSLVLWGGGASAWSRDGMLGIAVSTVGVVIYNRATAAAKGRADAQPPLLPTHLAAGPQRYRVA